MLVNILSIFTHRIKMYARPKEDSTGPGWQRGWAHAAETCCSPTTRATQSGLFRGLPVHPPAGSALLSTLPPTRCRPHPRLDLTWPVFNPPLHHIITSHSENVLSKPFQGWTACGYWGVCLPRDITAGGGVSVTQTGSRERPGWQESASPCH